MRSFDHAAASRHQAESIVTRVRLDDGRCGYGETLPRAYVTGETLESVQRDLAQVLWPALAGREVGRGEDLQSLPHHASDGRCINAARCAAELAIIDAAGIDTVMPIGAKWPGAIRITGVLGSRNPAKTMRRLRLMRWYGMRDFKLKLGLGDEIDRENLAIVHRCLGRGLRCSKYTLRVDVNGGWDVDSTPDRIDELVTMNVCLVEQPVFCKAGELVDLATRCALPLVADESFITMQDADSLSGAASSVVLNIRISKNGGMLTAAKMANLAHERKMRFIIGCMVGETGILSIAQRRLIELCPTCAFVEGNYGKWLLARDIVKPSPRFGYAGRISRARNGWGARVRHAKLEKYSTKVASLA